MRTLLFTALLTVGCAHSPKPGSACRGLRHAEANALGSVTALEALCPTKEGKDQERCDIALAIARGALEAIKASKAVECSEQD